MARPKRSAEDRIALLDPAQKSGLIERFRNVRQRLGLSYQQLAERSAEIERAQRSRGLSLRTIGRIHKLSEADIDRIRTGLRVHGAPDLLSISRIQRLVADLEARAITEGEQDLRWYQKVCALLGIATHMQQEFLHLYAGHYKCYRLSSLSREMLVTRMTLWGGEGGAPEFRHLERISIESPIGDDWRELEHRGYVFCTDDRRVIFLCIEKRGNVRQIIAIPSTNSKRPACSGLLLSLNLPYLMPFATRVYLEKVAGLEEPEVPFEQLGLFGFNDRRFDRIRKYIRNDGDPDQALLANGSI